MPAGFLDRSSPMPLWAQTCEDLRNRISAGEFTGSFPGEMALTEEYEVSRHTIREALRVLRDEGLISSHRGRPTTVSSPRYQQSLGTLYSLFDTMSSQGVDQFNRVLRLGRTVNASVSEHLGVPANTELIVLERLRCVDHEPLAHDISWLPAEFAAPLLDRDFTSTGLYAELDRTCGVTIDSGHERITTLLAPRHIAQQLQISQQEPVFLLERRALAQGRPAEWRETHVRGDHFSLETEWSPTTSNVTVLTAPTDVIGY